MKNSCLFLCSLLLLELVNGQTLSEIQMRNARASGYAIVAARNPGVSFSVLMIPWDGVNTLEYNAQTQINTHWHAQAAIKGNHFEQSFDGNDFSYYSTVIVSQAEFNLYKNSGTQWWIVCSTLPPFSNSITSSSNGNVGIGVSNPSYKLDVNGTTNFRGSLLLNDNALYLTTGGDYLLGNNGSGKTDLHTRGQLVLASNTNNIGQSLLLQNNGITALAVVPGGNIGIGTSDPGTLLHIHEKTDNDAYIHVTNMHTGKTLTDGLELSSNKDLGANVWNYENGYLRFATNNMERLRITNDGKIGIGINNPSEKLSVDGNVRAKKLIVSQSGWPDYVFDSSYSLRSLSEVEKFITQHKRLPEMPSANDVEEKGISVGDNQALLLKKIEELTLYVIALQKENERQNLLIKQLSK